MSLVPADRQVAAQFEAGVASGQFDFPEPGSGRTWERWQSLAQVAGQDLALGRLVEGHSDARAILASAGQVAVPQVSYGVWAAKGGGLDLRAEPVDGGWHVRGDRAFCSGAGLIQRALVPASTHEGDRLLDIPVVGVTVDDKSWPTTGMAASASFTVHIDVRVGPEAAIGPPGFYVRRPGFWHGGMGVAACWWGGARSLLHTTIEHLAGGTGQPGDAELAVIGGAQAKVEAMAALLHRSAHLVDCDPADRTAHAQTLAMTVRQAVFDGCHDVLRAVNAAGGARPLALHEDQSRRAADLFVYLAQHHGGRDAAALGRQVIDLHRLTPAEWVCR
jgi:alkylation response protein AidB-like acyl-CoA dehydrogenase